MQKTLRSKELEGRHDQVLSAEWRMKSSELRQLVDLPPVRSPQSGRAMELIVSQAIATAKQYPDRRISYSRWRDFWRASKRYLDTDLTFETALPTIDALVEAEILVEHDRRKPGTRGVQSSYRPAPWLAELGMPRKALTHDVGELMRLKDKDGNLVGYKDTQRTDAERKFLTKINAVLRETELDIKVDGVQTGDGVIRFGPRHAANTHQKELYRVFNGGWNLGGRFYGGWWQQCSKEDRKHFQINGNAVEEIDYRTLHAKLLYAHAGVPYELDDAYDVPGIDRSHRDLIKKCFNALINTKDYDQAEAAVRLKLNRLRIKDFRADDIIRGIKELHAPVATLFHSGLGMHFQNLDSQMTRQILHEMTLRRSVVCLPVHDSYIVPSAAKEELALVMRTAFEKVTGCSE